MLRCRATAVIQTRAMAPQSVAVEKLRSCLRGELLTPDDSGYNESRRVFNAMIDRRPALIIRCAGTSDVINGVTFARDQMLPLAVRGGGHNVAGKAVCDGGLVLDLSPMKAVRVDPKRKIVDAQPGVTLGDFDRETHTFGLATTLGIVSNTGIAGLTLGGGIGWLNGRYGLACDNLLSADVVTAEGRMVKASAKENDDLFWAIRGGSGNFGVVTSFEYQLHPVHTVLAGMVIHPIAQGKVVLRFYDEFAAAAPDSLSLAAAVLSGADGEPIVAIAGCWSGDDLREGESVLRPLRSFGPPVADTFARMPYVDLQRMLDGAFQHGFHHYWKARFVPSISESTAECIVEFMRRTPSSNTVVAIQQVHGATARIPADATAFPHRRVQHDVGILSIWSNPADAERNIRWTREFHESMQPAVDTGVYVNNLGEEGPERVRAAYGVNYNRLAFLKRKYDPQNFFRNNQNIPPADSITMPLGV